MFNEEERLEIGVAVILDYLDRNFSGSEVILVDDGSHDRTVEKAKGLLKRFAGLHSRILRTPVNRGKGWAVREGMLQANGEVRLFADADNATPIEELTRLLPLLEGSRSIVIGSRAIDRSKIETRQP